MSDAAPKGRFLIDLTDDRFKIASNTDVMTFIERVNPFAHSDVGERLMRLVSGVDGAAWYCPAISSLAYVVAHTQQWRVFAIAYDMHDLAFRVAPSDRSAALSDGGMASLNIGAEWVAFHPWPPQEPRAETQARLERWCASAYGYAVLSS